MTKQITPEVLHRYLKSCDAGDVPDYGQAIYDYLKMDGYLGSGDDEPTRERIVAAAINFGAVISLPPPARHPTIIQTMDLEMGIPGPNATPQTQGFITSTGRFVNRVEAFYVAWAAKQIISDTKGPQLYSEDLW